MIILKFGERIKKYRLYKGLKGIEFCKIIGISSGSFSDIENEKTKPSADTIASIVKNTDINPYWLLTGEGEMEEVSESLRYELLKNVIKTVEEISIELKLSLQPDKKSKLIVLLFKEVIENKTKIEDIEEKVMRQVELFSES